MSHLHVPGPIVDIDWLRANLAHPRLRVIDTRSLARAGTGTIPGARTVDTHALQWKRSTPEAFEQFVAHATAAIRAAGIADGDAVVCVEEISGAYAARAVWMLHALGHLNAALLDGGLHGWIEAGETLALPSPAPTPSTWSPHIDPAATIDGPTLRSALDDPGIIVLDTRSDPEWDAGTIPGAVHLEWTSLLGSEGHLLPPVDLRARLASIGIDAATGTVVPFCGGGYRAAHAFVVLRSLGFRAQNYAPSWNEWGAVDDFPIARPTETTAISTPRPSGKRSDAADIA